MRLPARLLSLARTRRPLGRRQLALGIAIAGAAMAVGIAAGSAHRSPSEPARPAHAAARPGLAATAALRPGSARGPRRGRAAHYRRTARRGLSAEAAAGFLPLYREAQRVYGVNWRLLASVHRQETAFSTAPSTYHGLNPFGCCAGPMQFNVTNGPVSTWKLYRQSFRSGRRPKRYPHRTRSHPSVYDDFDAIMAAGALLRDSGAARSLDADAWSAAYAYYGHDLFGVTYASQVLARAEDWLLDGFCANCGLDERLVAEFDAAYGTPVRQALIAAERRRTKRRKIRGHRGVRRDGHGRLNRGDGGLGERTRHRSPADARPPSRPPSAKEDGSPKPPPPRPRRRRTRPAQPAPPPPTATPPPPTAGPPSADECDPIRKLLGC